jgi:hypothetical protein
MPMSGAGTEAPVSAPPAQTQAAGAATPPPQVDALGVPPSGRRAAFRDVRRQLTDTELTQPGVTKLLIAMLEEADSDRADLEPYVKLYYDAAIRVATLTEQAKTQKAIEVFFGVGVGLGGTIIGVAPFLGQTNYEYGVVALMIGFALIIGAIVGRIVKT